MEAETLAKPRVRTLLCVDLPDPALVAMRACGYGVVAMSPFQLLMSSMGPILTHTDIVLLDVTAGGQDKIDAVRKIRSAICMMGSACPILCISTARRNPRFILELIKCGARYARISDMAMLVEAIDLRLAESEQIDQVGPCFRVRHRFSRGSCAPGEEIASVELLENGDLFQLPLALSGRFLFNYLAENRAIALDAFQIASGLSGWFYREHGLNGGIRQTTKVRVATVKVLVQRIRRAMAAAFQRAQLIRDPYDVLRSFPAEGSKRALYRLRAEIRWEHQLR